MPVFVRLALAAAFLAASLPLVWAEDPPSASRGDAVPLPDAGTSQKFFIEDGGNAVGPLSLQQLRERVRAGTIKADRLVWKAGTAKWVAARDMLEIAEFYSQTSPKPAPAGLPAAPPVKTVTTVPVTPEGATSRSGDLSGYLTGTWKSEGDKETFAFAADGTLASRGSTVVNGEAVILRGTFTVERTGPRSFVMRYTTKFDGGGGNVVSQAGDKSFEIVDDGTLRDAESRILLKRFAKGVELRLKPTADSACGGGKVLLSDDFREIDYKWGVEKDNPAVSVEDGKVKVKPREDRRFQFVYGDARFDDAEICVTAQFPRTVENAADVIGGVIFWAHDLANYYGFAISPTGNAGLVRQVNGKFVNLVAFRKAEGLNTQPGARNVLRVIVKGGSITSYVNGVRFDGVNAEQPAGGGSVGFFVQSESGRPNAWKFGRLIVSNSAR